MRPSTFYLGWTAFAMVVFALLMVNTRAGHSEALAIQSRCARLVKELGLTDLCLFTEARYTRHPAMADIHAPFQDHPLALDHFPSGSLVMPPAGVRRSH